MKHIEQKLKTTLLPEESDFSHQYRLRRALLCSSYMEEGGMHFLWRLLRFYTTQKAVFVPSVLSITILVFVFLSLNVDEKDPLPFTELTEVAVSSTDEDAPLPEPRLSISDIPLQETHAPLNIYYMNDATYASAEEMNEKILEASLEKNAVLLLSMPDGTYVYSFSPESGSFQPHLFPTPVATKATTNP
jgi:hypothetical protein